MTVEQNTKLRRTSRTKAPTAHVASDDWATSKLATDLLGKLPNESVRFVARAPGRLDVMGGIGESTGSLVLNTPMQEGVCVAMQPRSDGVVSIESLTEKDSDGRQAFRCQLQEAGVLSGTPVSAREGLKFLDGSADLTARCVLGTLVETFREQLVTGLEGGLSIVVGLPSCNLAEAGQHSALAAATLVCSARIGNVKLDRSRAVAVCRAVANEWLANPVGTADAACSLLGEPGTLAQLRSEPFEVTGTILLPDDLVLIGIDCGEVHHDATGKLERARTAAFMGRLLIDRIIQHEGGDSRQWDGCLSRLSVTDFVERFRDRLPTKLGGREFLDRFGETGDPFSRIDPDGIYKIRSRTEHHIYEHARACQFVECLSRAIRKRDYGLLAEAGELMYASHWSYGQRCGLGSAKTDLLVNLLRKPGVEADIFGAKMSGRGCGGIVTVLTRLGDRSSVVVEKAIEAYLVKTGTTARLLRGSSAGALVTGARAR